MAIKVVRNSTKQDPTSQRRSASSTSRPGPASQRGGRAPARRKEPSKAPVIWVAVSLFVLLTIILACAAASSKKHRRPVQRQAASQPGYNTRQPYKPPVDPELGMTWAEYEKTHNSEALAERKARRRQATGR